jgi:hypothetical protein
MGVALGHSAVSVGGDTMHGERERPGVDYGASFLHRPRNGSAPHSQPRYLGGRSDAGSGGKVDEEAEVSSRMHEKRVREVIAHYENQTEEQQAAEIEAALKGENITMMAVPTDLVPEVLSLIQRHERTA